jgi:hypothetical protein
VFDLFCQQALTAVDVTYRNRNVIRGTVYCTTPSQPEVGVTVDLRAAGGDSLGTQATNTSGGYTFYVSGGNYDLTETFNGTTLTWASLAAGGGSNTIADFDVCEPPPP